MDGTMDIAQAVLQDQILRQEPIHIATEKGNSDIQTFYNDSTIFITGGTGFLGKQLIEKLLRSCNINKIYILMRSKKGSPVMERLRQCIKDSVFELLREKKPDFASRLIPVEGDITELRLGLSYQDWNKLTQEVNIIFHVAATTKFHEPLRAATIHNVRGTREILLLAKDCKQLKSFVHVSTTFAHATQSWASHEVLENFYPSPIPPETMIELVETVSEERLQKITSKLIEDWPNTYTFTKAIAEEAVRTMGRDLPVCIVRPPIVIGAYSEPAPGWLDLSSVYGPTGVILGIGMGATHVTLNGDVRLCYAPVDYVNNTIIAAAWGAATEDRDAKIYAISNYRCKVSWGENRKIMTSPYMRRYASPKSIWYGYTVETQNKTIFWLLTWLLHYIPAYIMETVYFLFGIKKPKEIPSFIKMYNKIYQMALVYSYFVTNDWIFDDRNTVSLYNQMSEQDKVIFNFEMTSINWKRLLLVWCLGCRKYVVKDGLKGSERGFKKQKWLRIANFVFMSVYFYVLIYCVYFCLKLFSKLFGL
ncbi:fatty acyl-CoA reductase wat [Manduca sexta]|uniref:fatty acyl-CoA reductase wat n=1 Tax=Manduca sexta TaxID=7130 RepID=UPI0018906562|nr:fatty acyl-CoA reductase wat [Manduca sexta]